ncbi:hypothetical protein DRN74_01385 [Candidatus Micrarchaeota archaeon]|nr:MAG: hypothetical protein DRN74_01385 [Candidatus Micrarchaeota archaeon]
MARVIGIISGKGGVGKTTIAVNMSALLQQNKYDNILVETNFTSPTAGLHLGLVPAEHTIDKVLKRKMKIRDVLIEHPSGLTIVSFSMVLKDLKDIDPEELMKVVRRLRKESDLIILDGPDGLGKETILTIENSDDILIVTNPELPAVVEALRCARLAKAFKKNVLGVVINRVGEYEYELLPEEVENITEERILGIIPEDRVLQEAIAHRTPVVIFDPEAPSSVALRELTQDIIGISLKMKKAAKKMPSEKVKKVEKREELKFFKKIKHTLKGDIIGDFRGLFGMMKRRKSEAVMKKIEALETIKGSPVKKAEEKAEKKEERKKGIKEKFIEFLHTDYDLKTLKAKKKEI